MSKEGFSPPQHQLLLGPDHSLLVGRGEACPVHCRPHPSWSHCCDTHSPVVTSKNVPRHCRMLPGDKITLSREPLIQKKLINWSPWGSKLGLRKMRRQQFFFFLSFSGSLNLKIMTKYYICNKNEFIVRNYLHSRDTAQPLKKKIGQSLHLIYCLHGMLNNDENFYP